MVRPARARAPAARVRALRTEPKRRAGTREGPAARARHPGPHRPLWAPADDGRTYSRRERRRFADCFRELVHGICAGEAPAFEAGLYGLAALAREQGGLYAALRSESAVRAVESACRAPGAGRAVQTAQVPDLLEFVDELERMLRPLSLDWYEEPGSLGAVDVCHAAAGGVAALPGLLAKRFFGVPLLVTEYGVQLRAHYLEQSREGRPALRALLAAFHIRLAGEIYARADLLTPGNAHARRWQERCGAPGTSCGRSTRGWRRTDSPPSGSPWTAGTPTPSCGSAG